MNAVTEDRMIRAEMILNGDTVVTLAKHLKITRQTLARKISGESDFTQTEMNLIRKRYDLSNEQYIKLFSKDVEK